MSRNGFDLGRWIVADPAICHGKPTFRNTRIMVWQVLEMAADGMDLVSIEEQWSGKITKDAVAEALQLFMLSDSGRAVSCRERMDNSTESRSRLEPC
jgi:uncharacterized protein (DUF433 family)